MSNIGKEQCVGCGYTLKDAILHGDHWRCKSPAPWQSILEGCSGPEFEEAYAAAIYDAPYGWEEA